MAINWLTYKDIEPCLKRLGSNSRIIIDIKDENDIHQLIGLIIKESQEWELEVKETLTSLKVDKDTLTIKGIGDVIAHICNKGYFNETEARTLRDVVKLRNYVIHHFYLEYSNGTFYDLAKVNKVLNQIYNIINETKDMVRNKRVII